MEYLKIFEPNPIQWGLRGDPHLMNELKLRFEKIEDPRNSEVFNQLLEREFTNILSRGINRSEDKIFIKEYPQKGMSGGWVSLVWWSETGLPLIKNAYAKIAF